MEYVPDEVLFEILLQASYFDLENLCLTDTRFQRICQDFVFWLRRLKREFPNVDLNGITDYRNFYLNLKNSTYNWLQRTKNNAKSLGQDMYISILNPHNRFNLAYPNLSLVYLPDYRIAGTISDIVQTLRNRGIFDIQVGELYEMTDGQLGSIPGMYEVTERLIADNSIDPQTNEGMAIVDHARQSRQQKMARASRRLF